MARFDLFHNKDDVTNYSAGDTIFSQGDSSKYLYDVVTGEVQLSRDDQDLVRLGKGEIFGEVALINNADHSVTATAVSNCSIAQIDKRRFFFMIDQTPNFAVSVMRVLAERLTNETSKNHF